MNMNKKKASRKKQLSILKCKGKIICNPVGLLNGFVMCEKCKKTL